MVTRFRANGFRRLVLGFSVMRTSVMGDSIGIRRCVFRGDVVLSLDRPFIVSGTKVARVTPNDLPALLLQRVGRFVLSGALSPDYLFIWINSPSFSEQIDPGRSNGVPHISSKQIEAAMLLLPPLAEQQRLVAKVNQLMALCDQLEAQLTVLQRERSCFIEAVLREALAPGKGVLMPA
jgi:type I restriction enzyme S subunit